MWGNTSLSESYKRWHIDSCANRSFVDNLILYTSGPLLESYTRSFLSSTPLMGDEVNRIGLYCGAVALALSSFMIVGIVANTTPEERRQQELEFRDRKRSCCHGLSIEIKCTQAWGAHKRSCYGNQNFSSNCCCSGHNSRS
jgi:uncharacterized membrane protein (DUF485 family)